MKVLHYSEGFVQLCKIPLVQMNRLSQEMEKLVSVSVIKVINPAVVGIEQLMQFLKILFLAVIDHAFKFHFTMNIKAKSILMDLN